MSFFSKESFKFLSDLKTNNNKEWFVERKQFYQEVILNPLKELITDLDIFIASIDNSLERKPVTNKAISTIYRDTRYSKNKLPLKSYIGFNFRRSHPDWKYFPAFIFRIKPEGYAFGLIVMKNNPEHFYKFRQDVDNERTFSNVISKADFDDLELWGEDYKKYFYQGKNKQIAKWYCKKNLFLKCDRDKNHYKSKKELILDIQNKFEKLVPLYNYFNEVFCKDE